ncbi:hypothetical protein QVD99_006284 [Batrachochytrium dendrobatidis]|nr:hypothetical protein O5D80_003372 [Batrachochytrium dendrobatidis]KAK5667068.1 hypothetical protein QVD99_006284 [Batrachochytrium dendrobatidis]
MYDTSRSRDERLRELERERLLYAQSRPPNHNSIPLNGQTATSFVHKNSLGNPAQPYTAYSPYPHTSPLPQQQFCQHFTCGAVCGHPMSPNQTMHQDPRTLSPSQKYAPYTSQQSQDTHPTPSTGCIAHAPAGYSYGASAHEDAYYSQQDDQDGSDNSNNVCFAADEGGLRGKIRLTKDGKHSFVDLDNSGGASLSTQHTGLGSNANSLSKSLIELARLEKSRLKQERLAREHEANYTRSLSEKRSSPTHSDAFSKLYAKDQKSRAKYLVTDKALLEEERARNTHLEEAYSKLLSQVQQLQQAHLQDIRTTESRFHTSTNTLQKALVLKSEETITLSNQLADVQTRYERDLREWNKEKPALILKIDVTEKAWKEADSTLQDTQKRIEELNRLKKDLSERVATREQELIKYAKALRDREGDWMKEKEMRMKIEVKALKLEETLADRNADAKRVNELLEKKQAEIEELSKIRMLLSEAKREIEDLSRREKTHLAEIDQITTRERRLFAEVEDLNSLQRKNTAEISRLNARQATLLQDLETTRITESKQRQELEDMTQKNNQQAQDLIDLEKQARQFQSDGSRLLHDVSDLQAALKEAHTHNQAFEKELQQQRMVCESLKGEKDALLAQTERLEHDREINLRDLDDLNSQVNQLSCRLDAELQAKADIRQQNKDKLVNVSQKISDLQNTLSETQLQLEDLRENESVLRQTVRQREETIRNQNQTIVDTQSKLADIQNQVAKDNQEFDSYKAKKRDEILSIQEKFAGAKGAMEQEINGLRAQLQQKLIQLSSASEEVSKHKVELSELSADRFSLETRISELLASEASYQRQITSLQLTINQKGQEAARMVAKHQGLVDQMRRLEDEMHNYRGNTAATNARDGEISRLQNNMDEISRKLKSQVDLLLDRDFDGLKSSAGLGGDQYGGTSSGGRTTRAYDSNPTGNINVNIGAGGNNSSPHSRTQSHTNPDRNVSFSPISGARSYISSTNNTGLGRSQSNALSGPSSGVPRTIDRESSRKIVGIDELDDYDRPSSATIGGGSFKLNNLSRTVSPSGNKSMN